MLKQLLIILYLLYLAGCSGNDSSAVLKDTLMIDVYDLQSFGIGHTDSIRVEVMDSIKSHLKIRIITR